MGDTNAFPFEPCLGLLRAAGFESAYASYHGNEPVATWPSGKPVASLVSPACGEREVVGGGGWGGVCVMSGCKHITSNFPDNHRSSVE